MTDRTENTAATAGAPFAVMLRGALVPASVAGGLAVLALAVARGLDSVPGSLLGLAVSVGFYASGMFLLSRLVRSASPHAFLAVAMAVYFAQILVLLVFFIVFRSASWVDGTALAVTALVVTLAWQAFAYRALRGARLPVYDEPTDTPEQGR